MSKIPEHAQAGDGRDIYKTINQQAVEPGVWKSNTHKQTMCVHKSLKTCLTNIAVPTLQ